MLAAGGCRREQSFTWFSFILEQPSSPDRTQLVQAGLATFAARHQTPVNTQSGCTTALPNIIPLQINASIASFGPNIDQRGMKLY